MLPNLTQLGGDSQELRECQPNHLQPRNPGRILRTWPNGPLQPPSAGERFLDASTCGGIDAVPSEAEPPKPAAPAAPAPLDVPLGRAEEIEIADGPTGGTLASPGAVG